MPHPTPRVFIIRHGETEWSLNGRHTGTSDIPLTSNGESRIIATGRGLVGPDRLIVRSNLAAVFVSPRTRARRTLGLLLKAGGINDIEVPGFDEGEESGKATLTAQVTEDIREWDYGDYEGVTSDEIRTRREKSGEGPWEIWRDGCPGGESPEQITTRLDRLIDNIRTKYHKPALDIVSTPDEKCPPCDVLIVAHGHILRAFAARWVDRPVHDNPSLLLEAGGVGCLSYEHHMMDEPAILLGGAFVVDVTKKAEKEGEEKGREQEKQRS